MQKELPTYKKLFFSTIVLLAFLILLTALGEIGVRWLAEDKYAPPEILPPFDTARLHPELGWEMKPNYFFRGKTKDLVGMEYDLHIETDENGFRAFGDTSSIKPKVLFIGDSYTANIEVSNDKVFYRFLEKRFDLEVFAYGIAGYSTLQEYMILDKWVDVIEPDLIVWQFCCNDFIDNYAPLESDCGYKIGKRRPYLMKDESIGYEIPVSNWQKMKSKIFFFRWLEDHWHPFKRKVFGLKRIQGEDLIVAEKRNYKHFSTSIAITDLLFKKVKQRIPPKTQLVAFAADFYQPQIEEAANIFSANKIPFTSIPAQAILINQQQTNCKAKDGYHWNEKGQQVVANSLIPFLESFFHQFN